MASTSKTKNLGLSLWAVTDRPERADFRGDNEKLEEKVGGHLLNAIIHLTSAERDNVFHRFRVYFYTGTGAETLTRNMAYPYDAVVVFAVDQPHRSEGADGKTHYYADYYITDGTNTAGGNGVSLSAQFFYPKNIDTGEKVYHLNESGVQYCALFASRVK